MTGVPSPPAASTTRSAASELAAAAPPHGHAGGAAALHRARDRRVRRSSVGRPGPRLAQEHPAVPLGAARTAEHAAAAARAAAVVDELRASPTGPAPALAGREELLAWTAASGRDGPAQMGSSASARRTPPPDRCRRLSGLIGPYAVAGGHRRRAAGADAVDERHAQRVLDDAHGRERAVLIMRSSRNMRVARRRSRRARSRPSGWNSRPASSTVTSKAPCKARAAVAPPAPLPTTMARFIGPSSAAGREPSRSSGPSQSGVEGRPAAGRAAGEALREAQLCTIRQAGGDTFVEGRDQPADALVIVAGEGTATSLRPRPAPRRPEVDADVPVQQDERTKRVPRRFAD